MPTRPSVVDNESIMHLSAGALAGANEMDPKMFALPYAGWQICEQYVSRSASRRPYDESLTNMTLDIVAAVAGYVAMNTVRRRSEKRRR